MRTYKNNLFAAGRLMALTVAFALAGIGCIKPAKGGEPMTREEARRLVRAFLGGQGINSPGLNENNLGGAMVGEAQIYFEYQPRQQALKCSALIYKFHDKPKPGVLEGFKQEEQAKTADTGGGTVDYEPENKGLYLSRTYTKTVPEAAFRKDMRRLMKASVVWGDEVLDRVASKVFHPEELRDPR